MKGELPRILILVALAFIMLLVIILILVFSKGRLGDLSMIAFDKLIGR